MADNILKEKRKQFVRSVGIGAINGLLDELLQKKVLNQEEMEKIKCTNPTVSEKARDLCDSVIRKGPQACQICIAYICEEDPHLAETLGLSADNLLREKRKQFVRSVGIGAINGLLDELLQKKVLNQEEMELIKFANATVTDKARDLFDSVIRKGPQACQICIAYICEEDSHLAETLGLSSGSQTENYLPSQDSHRAPSHSATKEEQHKQDDQHMGPSGSLKLCPLEGAQSIWKEQSAEIYPIMDRATRTRLALIICNIEFEHIPRRAGADVDLRNMKTLLEDLGYTVNVKENLTALEMTTEVKAFAQRPEHKTSDSAFLVFMSHGIRNGICGKKYSEQEADVLQVNTIFQMMNTLNCPNLTDKPKVIIIQACRGENSGSVWVKDSVEACGNKALLDLEFEDDGIRRAHIEKDFIAFCSSTPDNVSWRHPLRGSLFIMELIRHMKEHAWSCDVEEIFRKVRFSFEQPACRAQMPTAERVTLTKRFYLFPGL